MASVERTLVTACRDHGTVLVSRMGDGLGWCPSEGQQAWLPLSAASPDEGWRPIETAPKDGTVLVLAKFGWAFSSIEDALFFPDREPDTHSLWWITKGHWSERWNNWNDGIEPSGLAGPTHWQPLPAPPALHKGEDQ